MICNKSVLVRAANGNVSLFKGVSGIGEVFDVAPYAPNDKSPGKEDIVACVIYSQHTPTKNVHAIVV